MTAAEELALLREKLERAWEALELVVVLEAGGFLYQGGFRAGLEGFGCERQSPKAKQGEQDGRQVAAVLAEAREDRGRS